MKTFGSAKFALLMILLVAVMGVSLAQAGAKLKISDDAYIDLGYRVQALYLNEGDTDTDGDDQFDRTDDFVLRRARFRLKGVINEHASAFLQTEVGSDAGGVGYDARVIDAFVNFQYNSWLQLYMGQNMSPALRQNVTSSGALMAFDRPGLAYRALTWGLRSKYAFTNAGGANISAPASVRDVGATLFGSGPVGDNGSLKYYAGMYNGIQGGPNDKERFTLRGQFNLGDAEAGYYNSSTYLGKKNTVGIGASYDMQKEVSADPDTNLTTPVYADYSLFSVDLFVEKPVGDNWLTLEGGWIMLDMNDATFGSWKEIQGSGFYGQAGLLVNQWQPWVEYETWSSDATQTSDGKDPGKYSLFRVGLTYFIDGHNANIKAGYESAMSDEKIYHEEDTISTFSLGFFTTY